MQPMQKQYVHIQQTVSETFTVSLYFGGSKPAHMIIRTPVMDYLETPGRSWTQQF